MKLMTTGNTEQRMKKVVDTLDTFAKSCMDCFANTNDWSVDHDANTPFGTLAFKPKASGEALSGTPGERAMLQLSERLGAGNFLPELTEWHKKSRDTVTKETLRSLWNFNVNSLRRLHHGPLLFRTNSNQGSSLRTIRAVLSNQYVVLNNYDLLVSVLDQVNNEAFKNEVPIEQIKFDYEMNDELSDVRFYFINDHIRFDDNYRGGVVVKNGECGDSSFDVQLILFNTNCANVIRTQIHYGLRHTAERVFRYSDLTNRIQAELVYRKAGEMTKVLFNRSQLEQYYNKLILAKDMSIDVDKAQFIMKRAFSSQRVETILSHWKTQEEPNVYGLAQAITLKAQDVPFAVREKEEEFASKLVFA